MELKIKNLSKKYHDFYALRKLTFTLTEGVYGLLGPNGAGKSTLMNILTDNIDRTSGKIWLDGKDIRRLGVEYRRQIGYMPQQQGFYDQFTAAEFLRYMGGLKNVRRKELSGQIQETLRMVNMYDYRNRRLGGFSGGMRQRIMLAQALLGEPGILILDEPTAGLDPKERISMRNMIAEISRDKIILIATHVVSDIEFIAKDILLMKSGRLLMQGSPASLLTKVEGKVFEIEMEAEDDGYLEENWKIANICITPEGKILRVIADQKPTRGDVRLVRPTLEDLYLYYNE